MFPTTDSRERERERERDLEKREGGRERVFGMTMDDASRERSRDLEHARKELASVIERIEGTSGLADRPVKYFRARRLLARSTKRARSSRLLLPPLLPTTGGRHLWILASILASILARSAWNYGQAARQHKVRFNLPPSFSLSFFLSFFFFGTERLIK